MYCQWHNIATLLIYNASLNQMVMYQIVNLILSACQCLYIHKLSQAVLLQPVHKLWGMVATDILCTVIIT